MVLNYTADFYSSMSDPVLSPAALQIICSGALAVVLLQKLSLYWSMWRALMSLERRDFESAVNLESTRAGGIAVRTE